MPQLLSAWCPSHACDRLFDCCYGCPRDLRKYGVKERRQKAEACASATTLETLDMEKREEEKGADEEEKGAFQVERVV